MKYKKFVAHCSVFCRFCPFTPTHASVSWETPGLSLDKCVSACLCLCHFSHYVCVCVFLCSCWPELSSPLKLTVSWCTCISHEGSTHWSADGPRTTIIHMVGPSQFSCCHTVLSDCLAEQPELKSLLLNIYSCLQWGNACAWLERFADFQGIWFMT